jgi:hypothetical protein
LTLGERFSQRDAAQNGQPPGQDRAGGQGRPRAARQPFVGQRARAPRSGAMATATCRAPRWHPMARCGRTSTARWAATRSTCPRRARTTAGRW